MISNSWIVANSYKNKIIGKSSAQFWKEQILELGGDYMIWSNAPENPFKLNSTHYFVQFFQ
jgi:putative transcriptional regulator